MANQCQTYFATPFFINSFMTFVNPAAAKLQHQEPTIELEAPRIRWELVLTLHCLLRDHDLGG